MSFDTNAGRQNGYYGTFKYDPKTNQYKFTPLGREIRLDSVTENIETGSTALLLSFEFNGELKPKKLARRDIADPKAFIPELADAGADVHPKYSGIIWDTLRQQQEDIEAKRAVKKVYERLGWIKLREYDSTGKLVWNYYYRGNCLTGGTLQAKYVGPYWVAPVGRWDDWHDLVCKDVVGHTALEITLLFGLAAVVNGFIAPIKTGENPILHLNCKSGTGKSTACELAVSTTGAPFSGSITGTDATRGTITRQSLYSSWGATENATIARCAGNRGAVVILNEIGKFNGSDMTRIVYHLSEGTDKERLTTDLKARQSETYFTTFISSGEMSLLERCKEKAEGLQIRVMELEQSLTADAAHADKIKRGCKASNGHAAPKLAKFILDNGGLKYVLPIYEDYCKSLLSCFAESPMRERFVSKFPALILTTAEIASAALDIPFDMQGILTFFQEYHKSHIAKQSIAKSSYDVIIEECRKNINCFYQPYVESPRGKVFGKITYPNKHLPDGRIVAEEYSIFKTYVDKVLGDNGFRNKKTCIDAWKADGVLDCDADRPTRSRKIGPSKPQDVYVFRVFKDDSEALDDDNTPAPPILRLTKKKSASKIRELLSDDDDEDKEDENNGTIA